MVWFYGISIIISYLMSNPVLTYILNIWFVNICRYKQLNDQIVIFLRIQFNISHLFVLSLNVNQYYLNDR